MNLKLLTLVLTIGKNQYKKIRVPHIYAVLMLMIRHGIFLILIQKMLLELKKVLFQSHLILQLDVLYKVLIPPGAKIVVASPEFKNLNRERPEKPGVRSFFLPHKPEKPTLA